MSEVPPMRLGEPHGNAVTHVRLARRRGPAKALAAPSTSLVATPLPSVDLPDVAAALPRTPVEACDHACKP